MLFVGLLDALVMLVSINPGAEAMVAGSDFAVAAFAWWFPWRRFRPIWQLALVVPIVAILVVATVAFGGLAAGTGAYFVLLHAWIGLNFDRRITYYVAPFTGLAYGTSLLSVQTNAEAQINLVTIMLAAILVGLLIATQIRVQRADRDRIAQAERWRAALSATLAHDLRSPLATVQVAVEMVRGEADDMSARERDRLLGNALRQVVRINRLAAGLLDMERIDASGALRLDLTTTDLAEAVQEAVQFGGAAGVAVDVDPDLTVEADPERLQQILVNLITNAHKHGRTPIVVRAEEVSGWVSIEVRDHGPGVRPEMQSRLFRRFGADGEDQGSVGLGLWIVDQLAKAHGGRVRYEAAQPGARFIVMLPRVQPVKSPGATSHR